MRHRTITGAVLGLLVTPVAANAAAQSPSLAPPAAPRPAGPAVTDARPSFSPPIFDPSAPAFVVRGKDGKSIYVLAAPVTPTARPRPRVVCGLRVFEADGSLDPRMVGQVERNPDPGIVKPPPMCGRDSGRP